MLTHDFYKVLHVLGIVLVFMSLGGALIAGAAGAARGARGRSWIVVTHGIGLVLLVVAGFGLVARTGLSWPFPAWLWGKVALGLVAGGLLTLALRRGRIAGWLWIATPLIAAAASWLAVYQP